jgi:hypothetical protein
VVKIFAFLDLEQTISFMDGHEPFCFIRRRKEESAERARGKLLCNTLWNLPGKKVLASFTCCAIFIGSALKATMVER